MSQSGRPETASGRVVISASQILEMARNLAIQAEDVSAVLITDADRRNALQKIINLRKLRRTLFPNLSFGDPVWDIILTVSYDSKISRTSNVKSITVDSDLSNTTALRYLDILARRGVVNKSNDPSDGRRSLISLTDESLDLVDALLDTWIQDLELMKLSNVDFELVDRFHGI